MTNQAPGSGRGTAGGRDYRHDPDDMRRWNIEETADGLRVCYGGHHRSADCQWVEYVPRCTVPPTGVPPEQPAPVSEQQAEKFGNADYPGLPAVAGRQVSTSLSEHVRRCLILIEQEQQKLSRCVREFVDNMHTTASPAPVSDLEAAAPAVPPDEQVPGLREWETHLMCLLHEHEDAVIEKQTGRDTMHCYTAAKQDADQFVRDLIFTVSTLRDQLAVAREDAMREAMRIIEARANKLDEIARHDSYPQSPRAKMKRLVASHLRDVRNEVDASRAARASDTGENNG